MTTKFKLSPNQERFVLAELSSKQSFALPQSYLIQGAFDLPKLKSTLQKVVNTYDDLRIRLSLDKTGQIEQSVHNYDEVLIDYIELGNQDSQSIKDKIASYFYTDNSLFEQPLIKFQIIRIDSEKFIFTFSIHHIIADGYTLQFFIRALSADWSDEDSAPFQIKSYLATLSENSLLNLSKEESVKLERHWSDYLAGTPQNSIPSDYSESASDGKYSKLSHHIDKTLTEKINLLAKTLNVSIFNIFYASYLIVLSKHLGESDICTSFQSSGRQGLKTGAKNVLGLFSRALLLRQNIQKDMTVSSLIHQLRQNVQTCISHQRYPYHYVIQKTGAQAKYAINWYPTEEKLLLKGLQVTRYNSGVEWSSGFDLNLHCLQLESGIELDMHYQHGVLGSSRIQILLEQIEQILLQTIAYPNQTIANLSLVLARDSDSLCIKPLDNKENALIYEKFLGQAAQFSGRTAIEYKQRSWTYAELDNISVKLGQHLLSKGVKAQGKVAIIATRCASMVMGMLASSRIGASFTVLDASYPSDRLGALLALIQADHLLICGEPENLDPASFDINNATTISELLDINDPILATTDASAVTLPQDSNPQDIAYYLFTSGTTGVPKCIPVSHSPLCHFVKWQSEHFSLDQNDRFTLISGVSHDPVLRDIFTPLSIGACIVIPDQKTIYDPAKLYAWFATNRVTVSHLTPPMTKIIHAGLSKNAPLYDLRYLFTGGDMLQKSHIRNIRQFAPQSLLVNFYGTTETPQAVAYYCVDYGNIDKKIPIGKAITDMQVLILNHQSQPVGLYEQGQVVIRTKYLSEGYVGSSQNNTNFSNDIFSNDPNTRLYFTGDYGYYNADYQAVLLGRQDDQVKIRGYRIELNEINQAILNHSPAIEDAITIATRLGGGSDESEEKQLVTYVVKKPGKNITTESLHSMLSSRLPGYMLPSHLVWMDALPLLPNGKIDRKKLPLPSSSTFIKKVYSYEIPETETENEITLAWGKILGGTEVGRNHSFVDLGGDSLSYIQASLALEKIIGNIPDGWETLPIAALARETKSASGRVSIDSTVLVRAFSIIAVVIGHFWVQGIYGATSALFTVAGYTFAKYQLKAVQIKNSIKPILMTIMSIAIPTTLLGLTWLHVVMGENPNLPKLLLFSNLIKVNTEKSLNLWFVEVLIQIFFIVALLLSVPKVRSYSAQKPYLFSSFLLVFGIAIAAAFPHFWDTNYLYDRVPHKKIWMFFLGWFIYFSLQENKRIIPVVLAICLPSIGRIDLLFTTGVLAIIVMPEWKVSSSVYKLAYSIAAASLFIYITHLPIRNIFLKFDLSFHPAIQVMIGITGGILIWHAWEKLRMLKQKLISR